MPKHHPVAVGMRRAYNELTKYYGKEEILPLYREGQLYNFYVKQSGRPISVAGIDQRPPDCPSVFPGQASRP